MKKTLSILIVFLVVLPAMIVFTPRARSDRLVTVPSFEIWSVSPSAQLVDRGEPAEYEIAITSINRFNEEISLGASESPDTDLSFTFTPPKVTQPPDGIARTTLTVRTTSKTPLKTFTITVRATGAGQTHSRDATLHVGVFLDVPYQDQDGTGWSGPTSLAMVLRYYGHKVHGWKIAEDLSVPVPKDPELHAPTFEDLKNYVTRHYSYDVRIGSYDSRSNQILSDIRGNLSANCPVLLHLKLGTQTHAIVITGYNASGLFFNDPNGLATFWFDANRKIAGYVSNETVRPHLNVGDKIGTLLIVKGTTPSPLGGTLDISSYSYDSEVDPLKCNIRFERQRKPKYAFIDLHMGLRWRKGDEGDIAAAQCGSITSEYNLTYKAIINNHKSSAQDYRLVVRLIGMRDAYEDGVRWYECTNTIFSVEAYKAGYQTPEETVVLSDLLTESQYCQLQMQLYDSENNEIDYLVTPKIYYLYRGIAFTLEGSSHRLYLHVYDDQDHHVGLDYEYNLIKIEIPNAYYFDDQNGTIVVKIPKIRNLTVSVDARFAGDPVESYNLTVSLLSDLGVSSQTYSGNITSQERRTFIAEVSGTELYLRTPTQTHLWMYAIIVSAVVATVILAVSVKRRSRKAAKTPLSDEKDLKPPSLDCLRASANCVITDFNSTIRNYRRPGSRQENINGIHSRKVC